MSCKDLCVKMGYDDGIEYGITRKYVETRNWGIWEVFREFVQNALDEMHEVRGTRPLEYPCKVEYKGYTPVTVVKDDGRGLAIHHLLVGTSEKKPWQRGRFGEGLKLALLASAHRDIKVLIRSGDREIIPTFVRKDIEGVPVDVFCVCYKKGLPEIKGTRVEIYGHRLCDEYSTRFVQGLPPECFKYRYGDTEWWDVIEKKCTGYKPYVYVRDIYVTTMMDAEGKPSCFSYNLYNVVMDESRRIPSGGSIRDDIRRLWTTVAYLAFRGDTRAYELLKEGLTCIINNCKPGFGSDIPVEVDMNTFLFVAGGEAEALRKAFEELYGEDMIFVHDDDLRQFAEYVGAKHIYCPQPVGYELQRILRAIEKLRKYMEKQVRGIIRREEMPPRTRQIVELLERLAHVLFGGLVWDKEVKYGLLDETIHAMSDIATRTMILNIQHLERYCKKYWDECVRWYIGTVGHELAHLYSRANDATVEFERELLNIMSQATINAVQNHRTIAELLDQLREALKT